MNNENQEQWTELDPVMLSRPQSNQSKSKKGNSTQSSSNLPLSFKILLGSILGWAGCFVLIVFIIGGGFEDIFDMDEFAARLILFISFPMGIIIGGGTAIALHKKEKKTNNDQNVRSKTSKAKSQKTDVNNNTSNIEQLIQLKQLLDSGAISQEEFDQMKAKIIN